jgi:capsular polysaccharide biosynthesis protein
LTTESLKGLLNLASVKCRSIVESRTQPLILFGTKGALAEVDIYIARDGWYLPAQQVLICDGFVPIEGIVHDHLWWRKFSETAIDPQDCERSDVEVCVLGNVGSYVFYHWIEELLKVVVLEQAGFKGSYVLNERFPSFCLESLGLLGVSDNRIIKAANPTIFSKVYFPARMSMYECRRFPNVVKRLRDLLFDHTRNPGGTPDRVWAARGHAAVTDRDLFNEDEVHCLIGQYGFDVVDFAGLSFTQQIEIDKGASVIAGPHGSAMVHAGFMKPNSTVIEAFSFNYIAPAIINLCWVLKHSYHQLVYNNIFLPDNLATEVGTKVLIDVDHLELILSKLQTR